MIRDPRPRLLRTQRAADVRRPLTGVDRAEYGCVNRMRFFSEPERLQHQCRRRDRAYRVRDVLTRELRR